MGVAALVLGIFGLFLLILPLYVTQILGFILGAIALVLGLVGRKQAADDGKPTGVATAGLVLGILATVLNALVFVAFNVALMQFGKSVQEAQHPATNDPKSGVVEQKMLEQMQEALRQRDEERASAHGKASPAPGLAQSQPAVPAP